MGKNFESGVGLRGKILGQLALYTWVIWWVIKQAFPLKNKDSVSVPNVFFLLTKRWCSEYLFSSSKLNIMSNNAF